MQLVIKTIPAPKTIDELGVPRNFLEDLTLKTLYLAGEMPRDELARHMGLNPGIVSELSQRLRREQFCEVVGLDSNGIDFRYTTTSAGKSRALELLAQNQYTGPAPVSFDDYVTRTKAQRMGDIKITPTDLRLAFEDLVLDNPTLNQLGTAVQSGRVLFLYGPTGTGKSIIAETLTHLFDNDGIWLPHAVEVERQIITVYDPILHQRVAQPLAPDHDSRWVFCRRPHVLVGGELTIEMLDLQFDPSINYYTGPVQMKANNGLLIIDDFGRQRINHEQLLNRWVVPLDRQIDFLTMAGGKKIEIPFDNLLVFASNMEPTDTLADKAFLRRMQIKIKLDFSTPDQFREIFRRVCLQFNLTYDAVLVDELIQMITVTYKESLRPCYPRDIVQHILWEARYWQKEPHLDRESVIQACRNYFLES